MTQLYLTPLPDADAQRSDKAVASAIQQAGLLESGGVAVENIATDSVDAAVEGQVRWGKLLSRKVAEEIDSLSESSYSALPLDSELDGLERTRGYYEIEDADVAPAKPGVEHVFQYTVGLSVAGTREDSRRSVATNPEAITSGLATGTPAPIGIPAEAITPRWYDEDTGTEPATPASTVTAEYGDIELYNYGDATATAPELVYDLPFERDGPTDVRVYDDRNRAKFATTASGGEVNTWIHAYHPGYQFDGGAVVDNGRIRLRLDADVTAEEWNTTTSAWDAVALTSGDLSLDAWSLERIGPANVRVRLEATDSADGATRTASVRVQRGLDGVLLRQPRDDTLSPKYESWLDPVASDASDDPQPEQTLRDRGDLS